VGGGGRNDPNIVCTYEYKKKKSTPEYTLSIKTKSNIAIDCQIQVSGKSITINLNRFLNTTSKAILIRR
jgi:hypothetical protein